MHGGKDERKGKRARDKKKGRMEGGWEGKKEGAEMDQKEYSMVCKRVIKERKRDFIYLFVSFRRV